MSMSVIGGNMSNMSTTYTKVYVWNTEPDLYDLEVTPNPVDLPPGNYTLVNCTGKVWDYNGWGDIKNVSAILYYTSDGVTGGADNNFRYINNSCGNSTTA